MDSKQPSTAIANRQTAEKDKLLQELRKLPIINAVCAKIGIGRATYYRWRHDDHKFAAAADEALNDGVTFITDMAESQLINAIRDRELGAIALWLRSRHPAYAAKLQLSGDIHHHEELTPEERKLVRRALRLAKLIPDNNPQSPTH